MLMHYKEIGDEITIAELNGIISLLRHNKILNEKIHVTNGIVTGEYGEYVFDIDSTTITDNGILITNETLTDIGTIKLTSPIFTHANYILHLSVYSYDDINIMNDETTINPSITTLEIELQENTAVNIPFNTLTNNCIVSFDAKIEIRQDKPIISIPEE